MKRRAKIIFAILLIAAGLGWLLREREDRGPLYEGRHVADWVADAMREDSPSNATAMVLKIGAPAVPFIAKLALHDPSHTNPRLAYDEASVFCDNHPLLGRMALWSHVLKLHNCVSEHESARWILSQMGANAVAAVPDVIDCFEHCPNAHFMNGQDMLDTLGEICGTNPVAIAFLTRSARATNSYSLRAAVIAYCNDEQTNLMVETCERLAREEPESILHSQELFWFREDHALNQHLVPLLERLYDDPKVDASGRESILFELESRSNDATAAIARLLARQTNAPLPMN
jgi:hypothetical protein